MPTPCRPAGFGGSFIIRPTEDKYHQVALWDHLLGPPPSPDLATLQLSEPGD